MQVYFFTKENEKTGSSRQRAFQVAAHLRTSGILCRTDFPSSFDFHRAHFTQKILFSTGMIWEILKAPKGTIFFLQRPVYNKYMFLAMVCGIVARRLYRRTPVVFDFDDAIYTYVYLKTRILIALSDHVIVSSHGLFDWAKQHADKVTLVPTSIDHEAYIRQCGFKVNRDTSRLVIGWVGTGQFNLGNLKILKEPLKELATKLPVLFRIVGGSESKPLHDFWTKNLGELEVEIIDHLDWTVPGITATETANFDIGVMPLEDSEFNRGKASFKAIEYMACGITPVVSDVGENRHVVEDGKTGVVVKKYSDWCNELYSLLMNNERRTQIGERAKVRVAEHFSYEANTKKMIEIFRSL